nr:hypothetical protein [uncultured Ruminococcus sp.]
MSQLDYYIILDRIRQGFFEFFKNFSYTFISKPHWGIFFTVGFKSLRILGKPKLKAPMKGAFSFGLPEGI